MQLPTYNFRTVLDFLTPPSELPTYGQPTHINKAQEAQCSHFYAKTSHATPRGSKYPISKVFGPENYTLSCIWDRGPSMIGTWILWDKQTRCLLTARDDSREIPRNGLVVVDFRSLSKEESRSTCLCHICRCIFIDVQKMLQKAISSFLSCFLRDSLSVNLCLRPSQVDEAKGFD